MRLKIINPNTTPHVTTGLAEAARRVASPGTEIVVATSGMGPVSIEGHYDEAMSLPGLLAEIRQGETEGMDGYVIACFGDPGLAAARELARGPVLGIAEAAMQATSMIATSFSIVTTLPRTKIIARHLVRQYGMEHICRGIRAVDIAVLDLENPESNAEALLIDECRRARADDEAGAIVLGCAGMADFTKRVADAVGIPVIDGVTAAVKFAEALVGLGLGTSKSGDLAYPIAKPYRGLLAGFAYPAR
jgi:allantoin racemase